MTLSPRHVRLSAYPKRTQMSNRHKGVRAMTTVIPGDGCKYAPACLTCPLPSCYEDGRETFWRDRNKIIIDALRDGKTQKEAGALVNLSARQVLRILAKAKGERNGAT